MRFKQFNMIKIHIEEKNAAKYTICIFNRNCAMHICYITYVSFVAIYEYLQMLEYE